MTVGIMKENFLKTLICSQEKSVKKLTMAVRHTTSHKRDTEDKILNFSPSMVSPAQRVRFSIRLQSRKGGSPMRNFCTEAPLTMYMESWIRRTIAWTVAVTSGSLCVDEMWMIVKVV